MTRGRVNQQTQLTKITINVFTIHLTHCPREVVWIFEADETETFRFVCSLIADDLCFLEGRIFVESTRQCVVGHFVAEVTTE